MDIKTVNKILADAAVEVLLDNILDYRTEVTVLLFETGHIFPKEPLEIIEHPVKNSVVDTTLRPTEYCSFSARGPSHQRNASDHSSPLVAQ